MAVLGSKFNAHDHDTEQRGDYEELPNGVYALEIEASDVVPTKAGTGTILKTTSVVLEPEEFKGRKMFSTYNIENQNEVAQRIGQQQFASLCRAIGVTEVEDSEQLHFHRYVVKVKLGKPQYEKKPNGEIVKDASGNHVVKYPARAEIATYYFPDQGNVPEPSIDENQPARVQAPANDNRAATRPAQQQAAAGGAGARKRPW